MAKRKTETNEPKTTGYTANGYDVPEGEAHSAHLELEARLFRQSDGVRLSKPYVQKFNRVQFQRFYENRRGLGLYINKVLHLPEGLNPEDYPADPDPRNGQ